MRPQASKMAKVLVDNYSLGELEDRLQLTPADIEDGFEAYVENNSAKVEETLREDLWQLEDT